MGLRFRKSISLCKGVRLNVGKTGVSISAGIPGFRKTIHSSGRVTTTVGVPGSGLYYVDTKNPKKNKIASVQNTEPQTPAYTWQPTPQPKGYAVAMPDVPHKSISKPYQPESDDRQHDNPRYIEHATGEAGQVYQATPIVDSVGEVLLPIPDITTPSTMVTELFEHCDCPVKWIDVLTNAQPPDNTYDSETWEYLRSKVLAVFEGDVEAMLEIIERVNPYDDLLDYLTDFEIEADSADCIEVTCKFIYGNLGEEKNDAAASLIIRLARDTFALLPVSAVRIRVLNAPKTIIEDVYFEREVLANSIFVRKEPSDLLNSLIRR